jgi:hypothetical protein
MIALVGPSLTMVCLRRVELGTTALRYRNFLRWNVLQAGDIQAVTLSDASVAAPVRVWSSDRQPHRLMAVASVDIALVGDWWVEHRGADWRPAWGPPPAPDPSPWSAFPGNPSQA